MCSTTRECWDEASVEERALSAHERCSTDGQTARENCNHLLAELKKVNAGKGKEDEDAGSSINRKYRTFYTEQLKAVNLRRLRSRFAASCLITSLNQGPAPGNALMLDLAAHVIQAVDEQRGATNLEFLQSEVSLVLFHVCRFSAFIRAKAYRCFSVQAPEVAADGKANTLILWPCDKIDEQEGQSVAAARPQDMDKLQKFQSDQRVRGRVVARASKHRCPEEICTLVHTSLSQPTATSVASIPSALGCLSAALNELCDGKIRAGMCVLPALAQGSVVGGSRQAGQSLLASLLAVALMQMRAEYVWVRKIAVVDCSAVGGEGVAAHAEMFNDSDLLFLPSPPSPDTDGPSAGKATQTAERSEAVEAAAPSGAKKSVLTAHFEDVARKVAEFQPQLLVCCLGDEPTEPKTTGNAGKSSALDGVVDLTWIGSWVKAASAKTCKGRVIAITSCANHMADFLQGMT